MDIIQVTDHSSSVSGQPLYEVFLSYRGLDMHRGFADFLHAMLLDVGISVFKDNEELERGKEINPQPIQVIEQSKISIPVISKEYASSESCLMELEHMVHCMDKKNRIIIPIFYYVDPSDVRNCRGPFEALDEHMKRNCMPAFRRIGELEGHHLHEKSEVSHGEVIKRIVLQIQQKLKKQDLIVPKQFVRVDSHVQGLMAKLKVDYRNGQAVQIGDTSVKVLGIYGISGMGKTVLAKYVYNQLYHLFDACSFLGEIRAGIEHQGILSVQNKLISDLDKGNATKFDSSEEALFHIRKNFCTMKALVLLDDVNDHKQLSALVGELDWLGPGSRVLLTSRRHDVLGKINGAESFVLEPMKQDEALKLFCRHAFGTDSPREEFEKLSTDIVAAIGGLPLELEVRGSSLFLVKSKRVWREALTALEVSPHKRVQEALEKSYANQDKNVLYADLHMNADLHMSANLNLNLRNLVILDLSGIQLDTDWRGWELLVVARKLKVLNLTNCVRLTATPTFPLSMELETLILEGCSKLAVVHPSLGNLTELVFLNLKGCSLLRELPDLGPMRRLKKLLINGTSISRVNFREGSMMKLKTLSACNCKDLTDIFDTIGYLKSLEYLSLDCSEIHTLPESVGSLKHLKELSLKNCQRLFDLLEGIGNLRSLQFLDLSDTLIRELPPSVRNLKDMKVIRMRHTYIRKFPEAILNLEKLEEIDFSLCRSLEGTIPDDIWRLSSLVILKLSGTWISGLPPSISRLSRLRQLHISRCDNLQSLPELPSSFINVHRDLDIEVPDSRDFIYLS